jgi:excisionase family DNA binding protein
MTQDQLLTTTDAARLIGVASETIRLWENAGKLPATRTVSGTRLFLRSDVERIAQTYRQTSEIRSSR